MTTGEVERPAQGHSGRLRGRIQSFNSQTSSFFQISSFLSYYFLDDFLRSRLDLLFPHHSIHDSSLVLFKKKIVLIDFREGGEGRGRERNINLLFHLLMHCLLAFSMCPDWRSHLHPWCIGTVLPPIGLPGQGLTLFLKEQLLFRSLYQLYTCKYYVLFH